jgi:hypothetical protein
MLAERLQLRRPAAPIRCEAVAAKKSSPVRITLHRAAISDRRPVTPEVAGSSPVAPVSPFGLQIGIFCCLVRHASCDLGQQTGSSTPRIKRPGRGQKPANKLVRWFSEWNSGAVSTPTGRFGRAASSIRRGLREAASTRPPPAPSELLSRAVGSDARRRTCRPLARGLTLADRSCGSGSRPARAPG